MLGYLRSNYIVTQSVNYGDEYLEVERFQVLLLIKLNISHCTEHSV